jgi:hypothetical protein
VIVAGGELDFDAEELPEPAKPAARKPEEPAAPPAPEAAEPPKTT